MTFESIDAGLAHLRKHENALLLLGHSTMTAGGGALYSVDFYIVGALKRAMNLVAGFCVLVEQRNLLCAAALLRMQIETAFRLHGLTLVDDPNSVAQAILGGTLLSRFKTPNGQTLHDSYLAKSLSDHTPWVSSVYRETSRFIHFTEKHIFAGMIATDDAERTVGMWISSADDHVSDSSVLEAIEAFDESTKLVGQMVTSWKDFKNTLPAAMRPNKR